MCSILSVEQWPLPPVPPSGQCSPEKVRLEIVTFSVGYDKTNLCRCQFAVKLSVLSSTGNVRPLVQDYNHGQGGGPPPGGPGGSNPPLLPLPDFSKPPPGFPALPPPPGPRPAAPSDADLMPTVPYYDLPAGLMAPLVKVRPSRGSVYE